MLTKPCGHMCVCEVCSVFVKKCVQCRCVVEKQASFLECCSSENTTEITNNSMSNDESAGNQSMHKLQQQLQDIKEQVEIFHKRKFRLYILKW